MKEVAGIVHSISLLNKLIWRHHRGDKASSVVISLHNLTHLPDDISSPDNFWCFVFEHALHSYVKRSSNNKNLELTFS